MPTRLIVNADDLGLHPRIDEGILLSHREGIVTSATVLVTGWNAKEAVRRARAQGLPLGVHLCLSSHLAPAAPTHSVRWLAPGGRFRKSWAEVAAAIVAGLVPLEEVDRELRAQVARAHELGFSPDHLDGHQHLHLLPQLAPVVERLALDLDLPVRWPRESPRRTWWRRPGPAAKSLLLSGLARMGARQGMRTVPAVGLFEAGALDEERLLSLLAELPVGLLELGCHPGFDPGYVPEDPDWTYGWNLERKALCSTRVRDALASAQIELVSYGAAPA